MSIFFSGSVSAKQTPEEAFRYQQHMAQAGYSSAIYKLGVMYQNGYGTPRDLKQAMALYQESFSKGYKQAEGRINEVKLMIESGDFDRPKVPVRQVSKTDETAQANLKAEREKLRRDREVHERRLKNLEQMRLAEQQKIDAELKLLHEAKANMEKEKRRLNAQKNLEKWRLEAGAMEEVD
ncbi:MAG: hypothetical protein OQK25_07380 [Gammaproteobacteria bacterium]|nr:hypothetical protein [Gammaproteobacteria bacterium]